MTDATRSHGLAAQESIQICSRSRVHIPCTLGLKNVKRHWRHKSTSANVVSGEQKYFSPGPVT